MDYSSIKVHLPNVSGLLKLATGKCKFPLSENADLNPDCGFSVPVSWHELGDLCRAVKSPGLGNTKSQQGIEAVNQDKQCVTTNLASDMEKQTQINRGRCNPYLGSY